MAKVVINTGGTNNVKITADDPNKIVKVITAGPKGDKGEDGAAFTGTLTGSLNVSGAIVLVGSFSASNSVTAQSFTGSLFGTASYYNELDPIFSLLSGSFATTGSNLFVGNEIVSGTLSVVGTSTYIGDAQFTGSVNISGSLVVNNQNVLSLLSIFKQTGSFYATTNDLQITGSTKLKGDLLVNGLISGNFYGNGDNLWFTRLGTSQSADSNLVIGNYFNNYAFKQTTTFKNAEVIVSGNFTIADNGVLILEPKSVAPTPITGGIYYQLNDGFYVTEV